MPLQNELSQCQKAVEEKRTELSRHRQQLLSIMMPVRKLFHSPDPTLRDIEEQISKLKNDLHSHAQQRLNVRLCTKDLNYPPHNVRQYIKGKVLLIPLQFSTLSLPSLLQYPQTQRPNSKDCVLTPPIYLRNLYSISTIVRTIVFTIMTWVYSFCYFLFFT